MGSLRVGHDWVTWLSLFTFTHWRRQWQPTPVFLPGESQGQWGLVGCCLWGRTESDTTEETQQQKLTAPHGLWNLSSPNKDRNWAPSSRIMEPWPLAYQGIPDTLILLFTDSLTLATAWTTARRASLFMGFSRHEYWSGTEVGCHFLLQGIFPTQESNPGLLHCRQILYRLSCEGSPRCL